MLSVQRSTNSTHMIRLQCHIKEYRYITIYKLEILKVHFQLRHFFLISIELNLSTLYGVYTIQHSLNLLRASVGVGGSTQ